MINCDTCSKTLANKQNLYRHLRNIHNVETSKSEQRNCMECPLKSYSLAVMKKHVEEKHGSTKQKLCIYCNSLFSDTKTFNKHSQEVHSLPPVTQTQNSKGKLPQASAFGGTVQTYFLEANGGRNFLQFLVDRKQIIDEIIEEAVQAEPKKSAAISKSKIGKACIPLPKERSHSTANSKTSGNAIHLRLSSS